MCPLSSLRVQIRFLLCCYELKYLLLAKSVTRLPLQSLCARHQCSSWAWLQVYLI